MKSLYLILAVFILVVAYVVVSGRGANVSQDGPSMRKDLSPAQEMAAGSQPEGSTEKEMISGESGVMETDGHKMTADGADQGDSTMKQYGSISTYSPDKLALARDGKVVLFFHAVWCPICRNLDAEAAANPSLVPSGVHILKVDFDTALDLRKKYGVTVQHTFVQVDANGAELGQWSDALRYPDLFSRLK